MLSTQTINISGFAMFEIAYDRAHQFGDCKLLLKTENFKMKLT